MGEEDEGAAAGAGVSNRLGFGTMLDTLGGYGCHIFIRGNRTNTSYITTRISNIYLV